MAIEERDRENLLRDGKMMSLRAETDIDGKTVVVGFRDGGQMSLYCGADPVFQFNSRCELRRVYYDDQKYAAKNGDLFLLRRDSSGGRVVMQLESVDVKRVTEVKDCLSSWIRRIRTLNDGSMRSWRTPQGPDAVEYETAFVRQLSSWLDRLPESIRIARDPNA